MFTVSSNHPPTLASASARWIESHIAVTRRHYMVVALCNSAALGNVQQGLRTALGARPVKESLTKLVACDQDLSRLSVGFEVDDRERNRLIETVRRVCTLPGVRYVRLDPH